MKNEDRAFPSLFPGGGNQGLTKREFFAAMAMQGILASLYQKEIPGTKDHFTADYAKDAAEVAIMFSDALLEKLST